MTDYGHPTYENGNKQPTLGDYASGVSNIRPSEIPRALIRQLPWMLVLLIPLLLASWWFTKDIKRQYSADGKILVQLGSEHVYTPATGTQNSGLTTTPDQIVLTEVDIIKNSDILDQVINIMISSPANGGVGGERFAPKLYTKWVKAPSGEKIDRWNDIVKYVDKSYAVVPKPKSSIVDLYYKHEDGAVAVKTLDVFINSYQNFRKNKFVSETSGQVTERRLATEEQLLGIEKNIHSILDKNGISEFDTEQLGVRKRAEELRASLNTLRGQLSAAEAALASTEDQLRLTPQTVDLYIDDRSAGRLAQAQLERRQLLAKYLPTSNPVRAKEIEISELQAQIDSNNGKAVGGRRVGPNTVYQTLLTQRNTFQAQADSLREQEITLQSQLTTAVRKVRTLRQLGPQYKSLLREKETLEERLKGLNAKEQAALVNQQQQEASSENIKIITRPSIPRKGRNMRKILFAGFSFGAIFSVFMLALLRVFLDPKIYGRTQAPIPAPTGALPYEPQYAIPEAVPGYEDPPTPSPLYGAQMANAETQPIPYEAPPYGVEGYDPNAYAQPREVSSAPQTHAADAYAGFDLNNETTPASSYGVPAYEEQAPAPQMYHHDVPPSAPHPAVNTAAQAYPSVNPNPLQNYTGPNGNTPVQGDVGANPYAK